MSYSIILIQQIIIIFIIIFIGVICYKTKLISDETNSKLSNILLMLIIPMVIFVSYQRDFSFDLLGGLLISLLLALVTHIISIAISYLMLRRKRRKLVIVDGIPVKQYEDNKDVGVERISSIYANVGFMGIPLVDGLFGSEGVFYITASITMFYLLTWTHGVIMISDSESLKLKDILKKLMSPTIIAIILGILFFVLQIRIPDIMYDALSYIGNMNTPFAMLIAGVTIGKSNIIQLFTKNLRNYYVIFLRLLLIPLITLFIYIWLPIDDTVKIVAIIAASLPTATMGTLLAIRYNKNSVLAAEIFTVATLLSVLTIPFIIKIAEILI